MMTRIVQKRSHVHVHKKKGSYDIHEKQVDAEKEDEDGDENCPKRSHVSKKKDQTIFMKNKLTKRIRIGHHHV